MTSISFDVVIEAVGERKYDVIMQVRALTGLSMKEGKALVETPKAVVLGGVDISRAAEAKSALERAGAVVSLR